MAVIHVTKRVGVLLPCLTINHYITYAPCMICLPAMGDCFFFGGGTVNVDLFFQHHGALLGMKNRRWHQ